MAPNKENPTAANPMLEYGASKDQNPTSTSIQDQALLKAFQDLIIQVIDPMHKNVMNPGHLGPEAGKLITALHEFISSTIKCAQSGAGHAIEVDMEEDKVQIGGAQEGDPEENGDGLLPNFLPFGSEEITIISRYSSNQDTLEKPLPTFEDKLLKTLRGHVFNAMPIRLLCFERRGPSFRIVLLERGAICARLAPVLQRKMHDEEFQPAKSQISETETDEERIERIISKHAQYAILSHTWLRTAPGEIAYADWNEGSFDTQNPGYQKLVNFCKVAWRDHGLSFGWMDTICINKESSSELDESIRSMYNWYGRATVCIVYLAETVTLSNMYIDPWFTRGWTLQELLAPNIIKFYDEHWKKLAVHSDNDKGDREIMEQIQRATTISENELRNIRNAPISRRMQLAAPREVTREEDTAYSLMGIFNVSISTAYGEGASRAFFRLLQEILGNATYGALDVLNWAGELPYIWTYRSEVLPSSPKYYLNRSSDNSLLLVIMRPTEPLTLTHLGLRVPVVLMPGISIRDTSSCHDHIGDYSAIVDISPVGFYNSPGGSIPTTYNLLDSRVAGEDGSKNNDLFQMTFAVFNFTRYQNVISLRGNCIAIGFLFPEAAGEVTTGRSSADKVETQEPIVFKLTGRTTVDKEALHRSAEYWEVQLDELANHGMQLINLYL